MFASRSVQLLETELSLWLVLDCGTVYHEILSRATHCHGSVENSKHFYLSTCMIYFLFLVLADLRFLADRTNGRAYATVWRLSVVCLFMAKRCVLEQKLQFTAYRKSYMKNRLVPK